MNSENGGLSSDEMQRKTAMKIARKKVLVAYSGAEKQVEDSAQKVAAQTAAAQPVATQSSNYKQTPIKTQQATSEKWQKYHSAWQDYYQKYYSEYYAKAAKNYIETEKMKAERDKKDTEEIATPNIQETLSEDEELTLERALKHHIKKVARGDAKARKKYRKILPILAGAVTVLVLLFLQYNRLIFAPIMAYVSPGNTEDTGITEVDPTVSVAVSAESTLLIPKLNIDVPIVFGVDANDSAAVMEAMNNGVAHFSIYKASAVPGQIGNFVLSGHSAGDIYSNNQYKFIFSGLERLGEGDSIYVDYEGTRYTYSVTETKTVDPTDVASLQIDTDKPMITLVTCWPLGTSKYRLLVFGEQVNPSPSGEVQADLATTEESTEESDSTEMPESEPTFFERICNWFKSIWAWLTGQN